MDTYNSTHTGEQIDNFDSSITTMNNNISAHTNQITTINNNISTHTGQISTINSNISTHTDQISTINNTLSKIIFFKAYYSVSSPTDTTFSGLINFNNIIENVGGGTWSAPYYIIPEEGIYLVCFSYYSNKKNASGRPTIFRYNSAGSVVETIEVNQQQPTSLTSIFHCSVGDKIAVGAFSSSYKIDFWSGINHNEFIVTKLK